MDAADRGGNQEAESHLPERINNLTCSNCGGELEIGSLYSPGRGNSRVYFSIAERPSNESSDLPILALVCRACGQISLRIDPFEDGE